VTSLWSGSGPVGCIECNRWGRPGKRVPIKFEILEPPGGSGWDPVVESTRALTFAGLHIRQKFVVVGFGTHAKY
jgi:hypothetical protein